MRESLISMLLLLISGNIHSQLTRKLYITEFKTSKSVDVIYVNDKTDADIWLNVVNSPYPTMDNAVMLTTRQGDASIVFHPVENLSSAIKVYMFGVNEPNLRRFPRSKIVKYCELLVKNH